jgi:hypothetical protein
LAQEKENKFTLIISSLLAWLASVGKPEAAATCQDVQEEGRRNQNAELGPQSHLPRCHIVT